MNAPTIRLNLLPGSRPTLRLVPSKCETPGVDSERSGEVGDFVAKRTPKRAGGKGDEACSYAAAFLGPDISDDERLRRVCKHLGEASWQLKRLSASGTNQLLDNAAHLLECLDDLIQTISCERRRHCEFLPHKEFAMVLEATATKLRGNRRTAVKVAERLRDMIEGALDSGATNQEISTLIACKKDVERVIPSRFGPKSARPSLLGDWSQQIHAVRERAITSTEEGRRAAAERIVKSCARADGVSQKKSEAIFQHVRQGLGKQPGRVRTKHSKK